ncbi:hypothetical protein ACJZ2D_010652 [Fusarium nematophilum]
MAFLSNRYKLLIQLTQTLLIVTVLILSVVRLLDRPAGAPRTRSNTIALGMSAKSLVIILYELLTEHVRSFQRWGSLKAYAILNALEVVFWGAVAFLMIQANTKFCQGTNCVLSWVIVALAVILKYVPNWQLMGPRLIRFEGKLCLWNIGAGGPHVLSAMLRTGWSKDLAEARAIAAIRRDTPAQQRQNLRVTVAVTERVANHRGHPTKGREAMQNRQGRRSISDIRPKEHQGLILAIRIRATPIPAIHTHILGGTRAIFGMRPREDICTETIC